jgi:Helix-turn-helix domain
MTASADRPSDVRTIGETIMRLRVRAGMSRVQLSGLIGKSPSWLYKVERGDLIPDRLAVLAELARVLRVDLAELAGRPVPAPLMSATARPQPVAGPAVPAGTATAAVGAAAQEAVREEAAAAGAQSSAAVGEGRPAVPVRRPASPPAPHLAADEAGTPATPPDPRRVRPLAPRSGRLGRGATLVTGGIITLAAAAAAGVTFMTPVSAPQRLPARHAPAAAGQAEVPAPAPASPSAAPITAPPPARPASPPMSAVLTRQAVGVRQIPPARTSPPPPAAPAPPDAGPDAAAPEWWWPWSWSGGGCSAGTGCPASSGCSHAAVARDTGPVPDGGTWRLRVTVPSGSLCVRWDNPGMDGTVVGPSGTARTARGGGWVLAEGGPGVYTLVLRRVDGWAPDHAFVEAVD